GGAGRFLERVERIRQLAPEAALRSSFILGYPGETEEDHDALLAFLAAAELDWAGFFTFSREEGTHAAALGDQVAPGLAAERMAECAALQDAITARRRAGLVGTRCRVLVDAPGRARSHREAPEIDGLVRVPSRLPAGSVVEVELVASEGVDLVGEPVEQAGGGRSPDRAAVA
ncbi:MAG: 30S ribosomal protein S12 methylthiotransferase RimO, partial [Actinomycetota bacterium]|nr:30S ribosomal protein S12 methylthiotransferase RimO [Actinomycetota bacterium]